MNILGDFISRVNSLYPVDMDNEELNSLLTTIKNQGEELVALNKEVERLQAKLEKAEGKKAPAVKLLRRKKNNRNSIKDLRIHRCAFGKLVLRLEEAERCFSI